MLAFLLPLNAIILANTAFAIVNNQQSNSTMEENANNFASSPAPIHGIDYFDHHNGANSTTTLGIMPTNDKYHGNHHGAAHHLRRLRRGNNNKQPQFPSLRSKSVRRNVLSSKSGKNLISADNLMPSESNDENEGIGAASGKPSFMQRVKNAVAPVSRLNYGETMKTSRQQSMNIALEVVVAQSPDQMHKLKEVLKLAIYYEQMLTVLKKELKKERIRLEKAQKTLKDYCKAKDWEKKTKFEKKQLMETQQRHVENVEQNVKNYRTTKRKIKANIANVIALAERNKQFSFANHIYEINERQWHSPPALRDLILKWETQKPCQWNHYEMRIWRRNHTTNATRSEMQHPLHLHAQSNNDDPQLVSDIKHLLLVDAAFDREAREKCLKITFSVPLRNWAAIAQHMEDDEIIHYVIIPLDQMFHGLNFGFDANIDNFDEQTDFPNLEKPQTKNKKIFKDMWHNFRNLVSPYSSRDQKTHQRELEAQKQKCVWEMLTAVCREDREKAKECVKAAFFIDMFFAQVFSDETTQQLEEAKKKITVAKQELEDAVLKNEKIHRKRGHRHSRRRHRRAKNDDGRHNNSNSKAHVEDDDVDYDTENDGVEDDDDNDYDDYGNENDHENPKFNGIPPNHAEWLAQMAQSAGLPSPSKRNGRPSSHDEIMPDDSEQICPGGLHRISEEKSGDLIDSDKDEIEVEAEDSDNDDENVWHSAKLKKCASERRVDEKRAELAKAQRDFLMRSDGLRQSKNLMRENYYRLRNSMRSKADPKKQICDFSVFYEEIKHSRIMQKNPFFKENLDKILAEAMQKSGKRKMSEEEALDALNDDLEKRTRLLFAVGPGQNFLRNIAQLSMQMSASEIRECMQRFSWFRGCSVRENAQTIEVNGSGAQRPPSPAALHADNDDHDYCEDEHAAAGDDDDDYGDDGYASSDGRSSVSSDVSVTVSQRSGAGGSRRRGSAASKSDLTMDDHHSARTELAGSDDEIVLEMDDSIKRSTYTSQAPLIISAPIPDERTLRIVSRYSGRLLQPTAARPIKSNHQKGGKQKTFFKPRK